MSSIGKPTYLSKLIREELKRGKSPRKLVELAREVVKKRSQEKAREGEFNWFKKPHFEREKLRRFLSQMPQEEADRRFWEMVSRLRDNRGGDAQREQDQYR